MKVICPYCAQPSSVSHEIRKVRRLGTFRRRSDGRRVQRFRCTFCGRSFSRATGHPCFGQNKRHKNEIIRRLLCGGVSQREAARILGLNRKTIVRKMLFWAERARREVENTNRHHPQSVEVEFDDLETFEHTKCKPVSVALMVEHKTRRILGFEVARMPAKGKLAAISRKKYGPRRDERPQARARLFRRVRPFIADRALLRSDSNPFYPVDVRNFFPEAKHETVFGKRGAVTGQGELKKVKWDPLFSLNHTCAMLRANLSRLIRRTWCTTKRPDRLEAHLWVYVMSHNRRLREQQEKGPV